MFWRSKPPVVEEDEGSDVLLVPRPAPIQPGLNEVERETYTEIAEEIGYRGAAYDVERLSAWMQKNGHLVWSKEEVEDFLWAQVVRSKGLMQVSWTPLREQDKDGKTWSKREYHDGNLCNSFRRLEINSYIYTKPMPMPALRLIRDIEKDLGKNIYSFQVGELIKGSMNDPFLLAAPLSDAGNSGLVIYQWDEPNFRGRSTTNINQARTAIKQAIDKS